MKVAYISPASFSDVDISFLSEMQYNHDITYYLYLYPSGLRRSAVNIRKVYPINGVLPHTVYSELDALSRILHKVTFNVCNITKDKTFSLARLKASFRLFKSILSSKSDIIHMTMVPGLTMLWLYLFRKKIIITIHDPILHSSTTSKILRIERFIAMKLCKNFILLNNSQKNEFIQYYSINTISQRIFSSQLGSYKYLRYLSKSQVPKEKYILFFGMIYSYKGLQYLLPAMVKLHEFHQDVKLIVAGGGQYTFDIEAYKSLPYIEIRNRFIPDTELAELIDGAMFVIAPYTDATQSGVVMSAYAFNKPCVVTNVGGLPEMVKNRQTGLVINANSIDAIVEAIDELLRNPSQLSKYSDNIKLEYEVGNHSWKNIARSISYIYKEIVI